MVCFKVNFLLQDNKVLSYIIWFNSYCKNKVVFLDCFSASFCLTLRIKMFIWFSICCKVVLYDSFSLMQTHARMHAHSRTHTHTGELVDLLCVEVSPSHQGSELLHGIKTVGKIQICWNNAGFWLCQITAQCAPVNVPNVDKMASNGVLHELKAVMIPPSGNIVEAVADCPVFKTLVTAVKAAGLVGALSGQFKTLFFCSFVLVWLTLHQKQTKWLYVMILTSSGCTAIKLPLDFSYVYCSCKGRPF